MDMEMAIRRQDNKEFLSGEQPRRIAIFETMNNEAERSEAAIR